ncbi:MAG: micrococcal nuclease [Actinomycetota bacterium]|nr:micrococcal nuclease [Actinomycetota bacterium]
MVVTALAIAAMSACSARQVDPVASPPGVTKVIRVVDGDTLIVEPKVRIRLIGVDAPESVAPNRPIECMGREASRFLSELLPPGTEVRLESDVELLDSYDRTLAYLWIGSSGLFVNAELVRQGFAQTLTIPPNIAYADEFANLAIEARLANRGLWSACP